MNRRVLNTRLAWCDRHFWERVKDNRSNAQYYEWIGGRIEGEGEDFIPHVGEDE